MKRIAFLAEVRNRALRPLDMDSSTRYDRLLYINDVVFNPIDAVQLLFSTNINSDGRADYGAACALDFINPFKFYDRFATRDFEGYTLGIPFFPFFTDAGSAVSRNDILNQVDAVRVRSCWGGMTAFEARWFQEKSVRRNSSDEPLKNALSDITADISPLRFRYEKDPFWDASECCLIHADLTFLRHGRDAKISGIFTNPYIRVAYDSKSLGWLPITRRVERLYPIVHNLLNHLVGMPSKNPRRLEMPGDEVVEKVWKFETGNNGNNHRGHYEDVERRAGTGRFCGNRQLLVLNENPKKGEKRWKSVPLPQPPS
jgi:hypothetical protein